MNTDHLRNSKAFRSQVERYKRQIVTHFERSRNGNGDELRLTDAMSGARGFAEGLRWFDNDLANEIRAEFDAVFQSETEKTFAHMPIGSDR